MSTSKAGKLEYHNQSCYYYWMDKNLIYVSEGFEHSYWHSQNEYCIRYCTTLQRKLSQKDWQVSQEAACRISKVHTTWLKWKNKNSFKSGLAFKIIDKYQ